MVGSVWFLGGAAAESRPGGSPRVAAVVALCAVLLLDAPAARSEQFDVITKLSDTSAATVWRIDVPNVKQHKTDYPTVRFVAGDTVRIDAGGCAQTGGSGRTWKRYVDPAGPNADRLYHGLIFIPGVNRGLERIQQFGLNRQYQIPSPLPAGVNAGQQFLQLGYEDDNYSDNGYWGHDDGTGDQCKNSVNAFVIVSIGHDGALAPDASQFVGIKPNQFRCQAGWAFANFNTPSLSWSSFTNAFSLGVLDYADPATYVTYLAARGMASGGNCAGMSLLADVGEDQFVVGDIKESFWSNYKSRMATAPNVVTDINTAHWKQLSAFFLRNWLSTVENHPMTNVDAIERDLTKANFNYGLLTLQHGFSGHVLVPLRVSRSGAKAMIDVYDPNRPCGSIPDGASYPQVVVNGTDWSYDMGSDGVWTGSGSGLGYVPYYGQDGWSDLGTDLAGITKIIFGKGATVEQVSDSKGRKLYLDGRPGVLDTSPNGLHGVIKRLPSYAAANEPKRPRTAGPSFALNHAVAATPAIAAQERELEAEFAADYDGSAEIYLATDPELSELTFTVSGRPSQAVRTLVGRDRHFVEVRSAAATAVAAHPLVTLHAVKDVEAGVSVHSADNAPLKLTFTHGAVSLTDKTVQVQKTAELAATGAMKAALGANGDLQISTAGPPGSVQITKTVFDMRGAPATRSNATSTLLPLH